MRCLATFALLATVLLAGHGDAATPPQGAPARKSAFNAVHYRVAATLDPASHLLSSQATVDFVAQVPSSILEVELNANLRMNSVSGADRKPLPFDRIGDAGTLRVTLPGAITLGARTTLTFDYSGPLAGDVTGSGGVQLAYIGKEGSYLLQPARWFPLTNYPENRYTAVFEISVPEDMAVVGTGRSAAPTFTTVTPRAPAPAKAETPAPSRLRELTQPKLEPPKPAAPVRLLVYTFTTEEPMPTGSFVAGALQLVPTANEGTQVPVYVAPAAKDTAAEYGASLGRAITVFSDEFGSLRQPAMTVVQFPNLPNVPRGFSAPGLIAVSFRAWTPRPDDRLLARLAALQWWGNEVLPASRGDAWLSDGLARYSEAIYAQQHTAEAGFRQALEDFAVGALSYEDAAPISEAARLEPFTPQYNSVVMNKGAMVFHMLRSLLGDDAFRGLLREYYQTFQSKAATIEDFQKLAQKAASANTQSPLRLAPFFGQWLNSTGIPEFKLEYVVVRTRQGFRIVGKVKQDLETFRMTVGVLVATDGNPEKKFIDIVGTESNFAIETFGRPKPGGIQLDPDNYLLKSSPHLRVRAAIARGEGLAEQGKYYDAILEYQEALEMQPSSSLAHFRMAEAYFYQKNRQAAANAFRDAINGDQDPKWIAVWSHIYLGKIFDISGQRERAVNEYRRAQETNDDTGGAQAEVEKYLKEPYQEG